VDSIAEVGQIGVRFIGNEAYRTFPTNIVTVGKDPFIPRGQQADFNIMSRSIEFSVENVDDVHEIESLWFEEDPSSMRMPPWSAKCVTIASFETDPNRLWCSLEADLPPKGIPINAKFTVYNLMVGPTPIGRVGATGAAIVPGLALTLLALMAMLLM
jgi:hypothetical protein